MLPMPFVKIVTPVSSSLLNVTMTQYINRNSVNVLLDMNSKLMEIVDDAVKLNSIFTCFIVVHIVFFDHIEAIQGQYLSPIETNVAQYGECGTCADSHAACMKAADQRTCWCRAGYVKNGDKCGKNSSED